MEERGAALQGSCTDAGRATREAARFTPVYVGLLTRTPAPRRGRIQSTLHWQVPEKGQRALQRMRRKSKIVS